jgi:hypothetical protein
LVNFEQPTPDAAPQRGLRHVLQDELGFEDPPQVPVGAVEAILGIKTGKPFQRHGGGSVNIPHFFCGIFTNTNPLNSTTVGSSNGVRQEEIS